MSPSMRREWIEMENRFGVSCVRMSPSMRREWIEIKFGNQDRNTWISLPPCGGSGLKFHIFCGPVIVLYVSLHAEGVD